MKATSGLSAECLGFVGRSLSVRLANGWGWRVQHDYGNNSRDFDEIHQLNGEIALVTPTRFYRHYGVLRALKADVHCPGYSIDGMEVLAFSLNDGFDWNFSSNVCPQWRLLFGNGEPQFPFWKSPWPWPRIFKNGIIAGFGTDLKEAGPDQALHPTSTNHDLQNIVRP